MSKKQKDPIKDDHVHVKVEETPGCQVKMEITVTPEGTKAAYIKATKAVNQEISLPGFRKGRAPDSLVLQHYKPYVEREWRDILVNTSLNQAIDSTKLYPLRDSLERPEIKKCSLEEGTELHVSFEKMPHVPDLNPQEIQLPKIEREDVKEDNVEQILEELRHNYADWEEITDRPLQLGDFVELDIQTVEEPSKQICADTRFEVTEGKMASWMQKLLIGLSTGQSIEGMSEKEPEETTSQENPVEFIPTLCRLTVKAVKKAILPALDDELAQKTGASSLTDLREKIKVQLEHAADEKVKQKLRKEIEKVLTSHYSFDLPLSFITEETKARKQKMVKNLEQQKGAKATPEEIEEIEETAKKRAIEALHILFHSRKIAQENSLSVSQEEILREFTKQMWNTAPENSVLHSSMEPQEIRNKLSTLLLTEKALDHLISQATLIV